MVWLEFKGRKKISASEEAKNKKVYTCKKDSKESNVRWAVWTKTTWIVDDLNAGNSKALEDWTVAYCWEKHPVFHLSCPHFSAQASLLHFVPSVNDNIRAALIFANQSQSIPDQVITREITAVC